MTDPYARVTRAGRWAWLVVIVDGLSLYGPSGHGWMVFGRARACRKARRELDRYLVRRARRAEYFTVETP